MTVQSIVSQCVMWPVKQKEKVASGCIPKSLVFRIKGSALAPLIEQNLPVLELHFGHNKRWESGGQRLTS